MKTHPLHKIAGYLVCKKFNNREGITVKKDFACCGKEDIQEQLPLFSSGEKSRVTQLCKVDMLVVVKNEVKVIIEIEESGMIPTKLCGKFLTSGLAQYYMPYKKEKIPISKNLLFIQILSSERIPEKSSIQPQWINIKNALKSIREIGGKKVSYELIIGAPNDFGEKNARELLRCIERFIG